jgi:hypothetical protein
MTELNPISRELLINLLNSNRSFEDLIIKIFNHLKTLNEYDAKSLIYATLKLVFYLGDHKIGKARRDNLLDLIIISYKYFDKEVIKLIVVLDKIQYTQIYFLLLKEIIYKSTEDLEPLKIATLSKISNVFFKLVEVCNKCLETGQEISPYFFRLLQDWIKHFPNEFAKLLGDGSHNDKRKKKRTIEQKSSYSVKLITNLFNHFEDSKVNEIYSIFFEIELINRKKILKKDENNLQKLNYADICMKGFVASFENKKIRDSSEFKSIFPIRKEEKIINDKLNKRKDSLNRDSHYKTIGELKKVDKYNKLLKSAKDNCRFEYFSCHLYDTETKQYYDITIVYNNIKDKNYKDLINKDEEYLSLIEISKKVNSLLEDASKNLSKLIEEIKIQSNELYSELKKNDYYISLVKDATISNEIINDIYEKINNDTSTKFNQLLIEKLKEYHNSLFKDK